MSELNSMTSDEVTYCAVHPDRETSLRCNKCDRYMCSKCAVQTPVGYRCRECIRQLETKFYNASDIDQMLTFAVCAIITGVLAAIVQAMGIPIFIMLILGLPLGGGFVAEAALRLTQRRRGRNSAYIATGGVLIGGFAGGFAHAYITYSNLVNEMAAVMARAGSDLPPEYQPMMPGMLEFALNSVFYNFTLLLFIGIVAVGVYGRYRMRS
jgi:MFS family permease